MDKKHFMRLYYEENNPHIKNWDDGQHNNKNQFIFELIQFWSIILNVKLMMVKIFVELRLAGLASSKDNVIFYNQHVFNLTNSNEN